MRPRPGPADLRETMRALTALILVCLGLAAGSGQPEQLVASAYAYDATHDVLPDWLWDAGLPGSAR
jgi:hypothetical protein